MEELFQQLLETAQVAQDLQGMAGRVYGIQLGVCTDRNDPDNRGRIKATLASKGGVSKSDWLTRLEPMPRLSLPVPNLGDTVILGYLEGDPHQGVYLGIAQNDINPAYDRDSLLILVGQVTILVSPVDLVVYTGRTKLAIARTSTKVTNGNLSLELNESGRVMFQGVTGFTVNGSSQFSSTYENLGLPWVYPDYPAT